MEHSLVTCFAKNVQASRKARGWSQTRLAHEMCAYGAAVSRDTVAKLELSNRVDITVTEWLTAALVLGVAPLRLLTPDEGDSIRYAPGMPVRTPDDAIAWLSGSLHRQERIRHLQAELEALA